LVHSVRHFDVLGCDYDDYSWVWRYISHNASGERIRCVIFNNSYWCVFVHFEHNWECFAVDSGEEERVEEDAERCEQIYEKHEAELQYPEQSETIFELHLGIGLPCEPDRSDKGIERAAESGNNCFRERKPVGSLPNHLQAVFKTTAFGNNDDLSGLLSLPR
jgi:hypothetical protein